MGIKKWFVGILFLPAIFLGVPLFAEDPYSQALLEGDTSLYFKDYDGAEESYRLAAEKRPGEAAPHIRLGTLYYERFRISAALEEFQKASSLRTDSFSKKFLTGAINKINKNRGLLGQIEVFSGNGSAPTTTTASLHAQAILALQKGGSYMTLLSPHLEYLLSLDPDNIPLLRSLAEGHYLAKNMRKAAKYYDHLSKLEPGDAALERRAADAFVTVGDLGRANLHYRRALRAILRSSANDDVKRKNDRRLIREMEHLVRSLPKSEMCIWSWIEDEQYERAAAELRRYLSKNPGDVWAMSVMAHVFEEVGQAGQAERLYKRAMKIAPDHPLPYFYWGRYLLLKKKDFWEALQALEKYRAKLKGSVSRIEDPEQKKKVAEYAAQAARYIATIYTETLNKPQFAVETLERASKESPKDPEIYYDLGVAYLKVKKKMSAIQSFRKVIELKPEPKLLKQAETAIDQSRYAQDEVF